MLCHRQCDYIHHMEGLDCIGLHLPAIDWMLYDSLSRVPGPPIFPVRSFVRSARIHRQPVRARKTNLRSNGRINFRDKTLRVAADFGTFIWRSNSEHVMTVSEVVRSCHDYYISARCGNIRPRLYTVSLDVARRVACFIFWAMLDDFNSLLPTHHVWSHDPDVMRKPLERLMLQAPWSASATVLHSVRAEATPAACSFVNTLHIDN
jgi:hypothetical protein